MVQKALNKFYKIPEAELHLWALRKDGDIVLGAGVCPRNADEKDILFYRYTVSEEDCRKEFGPEGNKLNAGEVLYKVGKELRSVQDELLPVLEKHSRLRQAWGEDVLRCDLVKTRAESLKLFTALSVAEKQMNGCWKQVEPVVRDAVVRGFCASVTDDKYMVDYKADVLDKKVKLTNTFRDSLEKYSWEKSAWSMLFRINMEKELAIHVEMGSPEKEVRGIKR